MEKENKSKEEFVGIINTCLLNLKEEQGDKETLSGIIIMRIINDIRLGHSNINIKLETLDKIFKQRLLLNNPNTNDHIRLAYEDLLEKIKNPQTIIEVTSKIEKLSSAIKGKNKITKILNQ